MAWSGPIPIEEQAELPGGTLLDRRFRIRAMLGEGGMGCVYLAEDLELGHDVALKVLIPRYRGRADREQRLLNEAMFARRVGDHPALPRLYGSGRLDDLNGCPYVAWEVVQGGDLNAVLLSRRRTPPRVASQWAQQLASALCAMHRAGVVHRDVTVTNVFIEHPDDDARVRLIDLSHAAFVPEPGSPRRRLTREFEIPGAHRFMPPEQTLALPPHPKMDVFSFGVVLHEMLTGRNPFDHVRNREVYIEMQRAGQLHVPRIDRRGYPEVPESLVQLVAGCTDNDVAVRLDMAEVLRRLDRETAGVPVVLVRNEPRVNAPTPLLDPRPIGAKEAVESPLLDLATSIHASGVEDERPESATSVVDDKATPQLDRQRAPRFNLAAAAVAMVVSIALALLVAWLTLTGITAPSASDSRTGPKPDETEVRGAGPTMEPKPETARSTEPAPLRDPKRAVPEPMHHGGTEHALEPAAPGPVSPGPPTAPAAPQPSNQRKPPKRATAPAHETDACRSRVAEAVRREAEGAWVRLESLTRKRKCFANRTQWAKLRGHALLETGRFAECSALGDKFEDPFVRKYAHTCRAQKDRQ